MPRKFFDVVPAERGQWAICCDGEALTYHLSRDGAISTAAAVALGEHQASGQPTGVRVRLDGSGWQERETFGLEVVRLAG